MTSLRAAVLVFLAGASAVNFLALKEWFDRPIATGAIDLLTGKPLETPSPEQAVHDTEVAEAYDKAWVREAIIVTVAGVAWFVVRARTA